MIVFGLCIHGAIWLLATSFASFTAVEIIFNTLDQRLKEQAEVIRFSSRLFRHLFSRFQIKDQRDPGQETLDITDKIGWFDSTIVIWDNNGNIIYKTPDSPGFDFSKQSGFVDETIVLNGRTTHWRIFNDNVDGLFFISVGTDTEEARQRAMDIGIQALYPLILIVPLTIIGIYWGVRRGLRPIDNLTNEVTHRSPTTLTPIEEQQIPDEIHPLVSSLNGLLQRLEEALDNERRFTANAAHELQTPLTAIKTELQLCQRGSDNPEVKAVLERIATRVDRAVYTVRQLLTLARLESGNNRLELQPVNLREIVEEDLADLAHLAVDRQMQLEFPESAPWPVAGQKESLSILVRNLLTNAFRYTSEGGTVEIAAVMAPDKVHFYIANDCGEISEEQKHRLVDRFYRIPGNESPGAGLGLSIVQRIVAVHQAELAIDTWHKDAGVNRGLKVTVSFPRVKPEQQ